MQLKQELKQGLEQRQKMVMTPYLQQSLKILQLSRVELEDYVKDELEKNPVLEEAPEVEEAAEGVAEEKQVGDGEASKSAEESPAGLDLDAANWEEYYGGKISDSGETPGDGFRRQRYLENTVVSLPSLREHLEGQLALVDLPDDLNKVAREIVGDIDEDGYFRGVSLEEVAVTAGVSAVLAEKGLKVIQLLDPSGVGARDLQECLLIQLQGPDQRGNRWAKQIIRLCFKELQTRDVRGISKKLKISPRVVQRALAVISALEPKPGRQFSGDTVKYIVPDIYVQKESGGYVIVLNNDSLPPVRFNAHYLRMLKNKKEIARGTRDFLEEHFHSAQRLVRSIAQRQRTLYKVGEAIFKIQHDFLEKGPAYLQPLKLSQVAEMTGVHESTVSRATSEKYVQTPRGLFELKYFFSPGLAATVGKEVSARSMKETIREFILSEDKKRPYSDQKLAELFRRAGVKIARRTVAKYREDLRLLSASKRKVY